MTGIFLSAWLLFPLLLFGVSAGCGILIQRVSGGALPPLLIVPVGFGLMVSLCALGTSVTWLAPATGDITVAIGVLGVIVGLWGGAWRSWSIDRAWVFPLGAAFVAFAVIAAPAVLTGTPTWSGYGRIVDIAFQMGFSQHLAEAGRSVPISNSSLNGTLIGLTANGYPGGSQATLGAMAGAIRTGVAWCYQPYLAVTAAVGALAIYVLLRRLLANRLICCIGAALAIQPNILYDYALEGGIKELTTASLILVTAALLVEWLHRPTLRPRAGIALAPAIAGAVAAFSYGVVPWLGLLLLGAFAISLIKRRRRVTLASWLVAAAATVLLAIPSVISSVKLFGTAKEAATGSIEIGLGNLTAPIPEISSLGVWISNDYRFPQFAHASISHDLDIFIAVLCVLGLGFALWRRSWMLVAFGVMAPIALTYYVAHSGPWLELKAFTITATMFLTLAFLGAGWIATARRRPKFAVPLHVTGWLAILVLAGAILYGNALTYHDESVAPAARYRQLEQIGEKFAGKGPAFFPVFDEYSELFLRRESAYELVRPPGLQVRPTVKLAPGAFAYSYDLNQLVLKFVEEFPLLVVSRSPTASRAPANYRLADRTAEFEVWQRVRPAAEVVRHLPLSGSPTERTPAFCEGVVRLLKRAGKGARLAYVPSSPLAELIPTEARHPDYWHALSPEALRAYGAGEVTGSVSLPATGTYEVWMQGSVGRPITIYVDRRRIGSLAHQERYPGLYLHVAQVKRRKGTQRIRLSRGNGSLSPGSGDGPDARSGLIGPLVFALQQPQDGRLMTAAASQAAAVCARREGFEWIEILKPSDPARAGSAH